MTDTRPTAKNTVCQTWCPQLGVVTITAKSFEDYVNSPCKVECNILAIRQCLSLAVNTRRMAEVGHVARMWVHLSCTFEHAFTGNLSEQTLQALAMPAVVADAMARSIWSGNHALVLAQSDDWEQGELQALPWQAQALEALLAMPHLEASELWLPSFESLAELEAWQQRFAQTHPNITIIEIDHIDATSPKQNDNRRFASVWFPTITGSDQYPQDTLIELRLTVRLSVVESEADLILLQGAGGRQQIDIRTALKDWRLSDLHGKGEWDTLISFSEQFQNTSYQLALALADRIARGREFSPPGRLIATGAVNNKGEVEAVDGIVRKCHLIGHQAQAGDRIVLPNAWQLNQAPAERQALQALQQQLTQIGASMVFIDQLNGINHR